VSRKGRVVSVDPVEPEVEGIREAAEVLRGGGLVAFPTETVYGLGGDGRSKKAVQKIFRAKGRPATNPLILHVADIEAARELVSEWSEVAEALGRRFWPGPLTIVAPRAGWIADEICAGLPTVAIRVPRHPVAQALLREVGFAVAAPSANPSTRVSPTTAGHVLRGLGAKVDLILDGGPSEVGLESTLISVVEEPPMVLREGMIGAPELEVVAPGVRIVRAVVGEEEARASPGMSAVHYAPGVPLRVVSVERVRQMVEAGESVGVICRGADLGEARGGERVKVLADEPAGYARGLYAALHALEVAGVEAIVVAQPPAGQGWEAVRDRLGRAAVTGYRGA
jgi:L-threonylcarbamoyladenylate synthase